MILVSGSSLEAGAEKLCSESFWYQERKHNIMVDSLILHLLTAFNICLLQVKMRVAWLSYLLLTIYLETTVGSLQGSVHRMKYFFSTANNFRSGWQISSVELWGWEWFTWWVHPNQETFKIFFSKRENGRVVWRLWWAKTWGMVEDKVEKCMRK